MKKNNTNLTSLFFLAAALSCSVHGLAAIKLPALFGDHMVLQQKARVNFWGWARPGEEVRVEVSWQSRESRVRADGSGNWKIELRTPAAGGPYHIKISGENSIELQDVLIGEVWLCAGQSNMTFPLKYSSDAKTEMAEANHPSIRYFGVKRQYGQKPLDDCGGSAWERTTPETAASFSAVGYYFAKKIQARLNVPVGIVCAGWSGTPAEAWTPREILQKDDSLQFFLKRWAAIPRKVGADSVQYHRALAAWEKNKNASPGTYLQRPEEPRNYYYYSKPWCEPGVLFNGMIHPLMPFTVKGILWYQGESNVSEADAYEHLFATLIKSWRCRWNAGRQSLPFYFVQIAPFAYGDLDAAARLRQAQYRVMKKVHNTAMVVTTDLGDMKNIHFTRKKEVGDRLALIALAKSYGYGDVVCDGPVCTRVFKTGDKLQLNFDQALFLAGRQSPGGFEIGYRKPGSDRVLFVKAQSVIKGNRVFVRAEGIKDPLFVRYAWLEAGSANLVNQTGLPAYPFQMKIEQEAQ